MTVTYSDLKMKDSYPAIFVTTTLATTVATAVVTLLLWLFMDGIKTSKASCVRLNTGCFFNTLLYKREALKYAAQHFTALL